MHPLDKVRLKLDWAKEHLATLDCEVRDFLDLNPYRVDPQPPPPPPKLTEKSFLDRLLTAGLPPARIGTYRIIHEPPIRLSLIFGDYIHNLRSTLDHLFYQLALLESDTPDERSNFPIFGDDPARDAGAFGRLASILMQVPPDAAIEIEDLQPYHRGPAYRSDTLWRIGRLDNIDKHSNPIVTVLSEALIAVFASGRRSVQSFAAPLNDGDGVYADMFPTKTSASIYDTPSKDEPHVNVEPVYGVVIDETNTLPLERLPELHQFVEFSVLPRFAGFFK